MSMNFLSKIMNRINGRSASAPPPMPERPPVYVTSQGGIYVIPEEVFGSKRGRHVLKAVAKVAKEHRKKKALKNRLSFPSESKENQ